jgi:hypothetical protein
VFISRYIALCHPLKAKAWITKEKAYRSIALSFLFCFLWNIPRIFERKFESFVDPATNWTMYRDKLFSDFATGGYYTFHKIAYTIVFTFVPLVVLAWFNVRVVIAYRAHVKMKATLVNSDQRKQHNEQTRVTLLLLIVIVCFVILLVPGAISYIIQMTKSDSLVIFVFICCADVMGEMNFALNFYLYCMCSKQFRQAMKRAYCKRCINQVDEGQSDMSASTAAT